jgi:chaperone modulatory protein CbpM
MKLSLTEICKLCGVSQDEIYEMVEEGILEPQGASASNWQFHGYELKKVQITLRLRRDLQVNLPGIAVIVNLLDEIDKLKRQVRAR